MLLAEADLLQDGRISYKEFEAYLRKEPLDDAIQKKRSSEKQAQSRGCVPWLRVARIEFLVPLWPIKPEKD